MAQRLATEYVYASLILTEADWPRLAALCESMRLRLQVCVLDNGNHELVLADDGGGESIRLLFERKDGRYACTLSCRVTQPKLAQALNLAVTAFRGNAIVNRIYRGFVIIYHYNGGKVARIAENRGGKLHVIYERRGQSESLEARFRLRTAEERIARIRQEVDEMLDRRNRTTDAAAIAAIDEHLRGLSRQLFVLEA
jgi:hypothetical protein